MHWIVRKEYMKHSYHLAYFATHAFMPTFTIIMLCCCGKTDSYKSADYRGNGFTSIVGTDLANNDMSGYVKEGTSFDAKDIPAGNYSGITRLKGNSYAIVSDKDGKGGYFKFTIEIDSNGNITSVKNNGFRELEEKNKDQEAIAYNPDNHHIYIGCEETDEIVEYDILNGKKIDTLCIDEYKRNGVHNRKIESLAFDRKRQSLFTINEGPLKGDNHLMLRLIEIDTDMKRKMQYTYILDTPLDDGPCVDDSHAFGVAELLSLGDGTLLVLEREFKVEDMKIGSWVMNKIFRIRPGKLNKQFITGWRTSLNVSDLGLANYEGMCLGPQLKDGRQVIIICADSQNRYGGVLRDWFKTVII